MEEIGVTEFRATCVAVLARVGETGRPVLITRFGKPVAQISPPPGGTLDWLGSMRERGAIAGDLVEPAGLADDWEAPDARMEQIAQRVDAPWKWPSSGGKAFCLPWRRKAPFLRKRSQRA